MTTAAFSRALATVALVAATVVALSADGTTREPFAGDAFGRDGRLRYREFHDFARTPAGLGQVTVYRDAAGREIGRMEADYSRYRFAPTYRMVDLRHDTEEDVRREGDVIHVRHRKGERVRSKALPVSKDREVIVGPGFNEFIEANWDALLAGRTLVCDFVVPSRLQAVAFRIRHAGPSQDGAGHRFTVSVDNVLLRLLAPELQVEYDRHTRALRSYEGLSNVNDDRNRPQEVVIRFPQSPDAGRVAQSTTSGSER
jgi:hypothetical protein